MENPVQDAREWRDRASALRALAKNMTNPIARDELLEVAERWDARSKANGVGSSFFRLFEIPREAMPL